MDMIQAVKSVLANYANFQGRARRAEYWWFYLAQIIVTTPLYILMTVSIENNGSIGISGVVLILATFGFMLPATAVSFRRLHDVKKSAWNLLWVLLPLVGPILLLVWFCQRGTVGENRFGADPLAQTNPGQEGVMGFASAAPAAASQSGSQGGVDFDKLEKLSQLHKSGVLSDEEFATQKAKILGA